MNAFDAVARLLTLGMLIVLASSAAAQHPYPTKPIRFIVPFPPGGGTDPLARMVAQKLSESWGQPVIVDNRPGGNTLIGTEAVAKAPSDGYTILLVPTAFVTSPSLLPYLPYDTIKDFAPVATISRSRYVLVVNPSVLANTLQEFIALAKAKPGQFNYGSSGIGSAPHLAGELFSMVAGVRMQHVPYKGSGVLVSDLISGQLQLSFQAPIAAITHIKSGKFKAIAITGKTRIVALPQVATFAEAGLPAYDMTSWFAIAAPAGTPKEIISKLSREVAAVLVMPDIREKLLSQGQEPFISTPDELAALIKAEIAKWGKVIKTANIKIEN